MDGHRFGIVPDPVTILVDLDERRSAVPRHLTDMGVATEMTVIPVGDYIVNDAAVERKTVRDLHGSVANGRLWSQVADLARIRRSYVLVEGTDLDAGPLSPAGVRGALLQIMDNDVKIIRSSSAFDTARWLRLLALRGTRDSVLLGARGRRRSVASPAALLTGVPGLSPRLAHRLLDRFGSIAALAQASVAELQQIDGIGTARARAISRALLGTSPRSGEVP